MPSSVVTLPAKGVRSLCWRGDELVDYAGGLATYRLDGTIQRAFVNFAFPFDGAVATDDGEWAILYVRRGTKGLLLRNGEVLRELNRSFYQADCYEYPVCLLRAPDGRQLIAHCPDQYNRIELEVAETSERVTTSSSRAPGDFFHSRLTANPSGTRLLSAGWVWHPCEAVIYFDVAQALRDPSRLDRIEGGGFGRNVSLAEESTACWLDDERVVLGASAEPEEPDEAAEYAGLTRLYHNGIATYDVAARRYLTSAIVDRAPGRLMPIGPRHVVALGGSPRLIELETGRVVEEWPYLATPGHYGSIVVGEQQPPPPLALDPAGRRFAVAGPDAITVVTISDV